MPVNVKNRIQLLRSLVSRVTGVTALCVLFCLPLQAGASNELLDFSSSMNAFSADFTQTVYDSDSVVLQESSGRVELMRPGKFRWTYTDPLEQVIVADGISLWVYDEDIQQVTVQPQVTTLGSAPIGLLSGERALETEFTITELGEDQGLQWFQLDPLVLDTDFNQVYIALAEDGLRAMELRDNFDQATQIRFNNFILNGDIDDTVFQFEVPPGTDVIGEPGQAAATTAEVPAADPAAPAVQPAGIATPGTTAPVTAPAAIDALSTTTPEAPVTSAQTPDSEGNLAADSATTTLPADELLDDTELAPIVADVATPALETPAETTPESAAGDALPIAETTELPADTPANSVIDGGTSIEVAPDGTEPEITLEVIRREPLTE